MLRKLPTILLLLTLMTAPALAGEKRVTVHVKGLACPFCTYNLEKRIKTLDGVPDKPDWQASVEKGTASFDWKADVPFDEDAVREQIRKAGFTPGKIEVADADSRVKEQAYRGKAHLIEVSNDQDKKQTVIALQVGAGENRRMLTLRPAERADRQESYATLKARLKDAATNDSVLVTVYGLPADKPKSDIILHHWSPQHFGAEVILNVDELACERCSTGVMRTVQDVKGVLHVEADHEEDRVHIWTQSHEPDTAPLRKAIEDAGFKVTHVHAKPAKDEGRDKDKAK